MSTMRLPLAEHPLVRGLESVDSALDEIAELDPTNLSTPDQARALRAVDRELWRLQGLRLQLVAASSDVTSDDGSVERWPEVRSALDAMLSSIPRQ
jgi:hypothetical protein